jgi:streptogramin lyase
MWVANTGANSLSKIAPNSSTATSVALPAGALPARMCFNGSHLLVQCTNGQAYRIDIYTNAVLTMTIPWYGSTTGPLLFDGVSAWQTYSGGVARAPV